MGELLITIFCGGSIVANGVIAMYVIKSMEKEGKLRKEALDNPIEPSNKTLVTK